jgi:hypothetical protein
MADPIAWYLLPRTSTDLQSIMEAIDAKILTHNQDPSAHGQTGEGIEVHRSDSVLDHEPGSVFLGHVTTERILRMGPIESLDGWATAGTITQGAFETRIQTAAAINAEAYLAIRTNGLTAKLIETMDPYFSTTVYISSETDVLAYIVAGAQPGDGQNDSFGFKIEDDQAYAYWTRAGVQHTQAVAGYWFESAIPFKVVVRSDEEEIDFYVGGILRYTATADFPNTSNNYLFEFYIKTLAASAKNMRIADLLLEIGRAV